MYHYHEPLPHSCNDDQALEKLGKRKSFCVVERPAVVAQGVRGACGLSMLCCCAHVDHNQSCLLGGKNAWQSMPFSLIALRAPRQPVAIKK